MLRLGKLLSLCKVSSFEQCKRIAILCAKNWEQAIFMGRRFCPNKRKFICTYVKENFYLSEKLFLNVRHL